MARSGADEPSCVAPVAVVPEPAVVRTMLIGGAGVGWLPDFHASDAKRMVRLSVSSRWRRRGRRARPLPEPSQPLGKGAGVY